MTDPRRPAELRQRAHDFLFNEACNEIYHSRTRDLHLAARLVGTAQGLDAAIERLQAFNDDIHADDVCAAVELAIEILNEAD